MGALMAVPLNYTIAILRHFADARQLAVALAAANIACKIESISGETHLVFVSRSQGTRAEHVRGVWAERRREVQR
jgi:hypothetical protein